MQETEILLETEMGFGMNILLSDPSVPTEALNENSLITVPCQVMPLLLTSHVLTISLYIHTPHAVISVLSHFSVAVFLCNYYLHEIIHYTAFPTCTYVLYSL